MKKILDDIREEDFFIGILALMFITVGLFTVTGLIYIAYEHPLAFFGTLVGGVICITLIGLVGKFTRDFIEYCYQGKRFTTWKL